MHNDYPRLEGEEMEFLSQGQECALVLSFTAARPATSQCSKQARGETSQHADRSFFRPQLYKIGVFVTKTSL